MNDGGKDEQVTLNLLTAIEEQSDVTQRGLARRLGVALGLTNSYLKRCISKGLIKIREAPANRYFYYLTPKGFSEKSRLTAKYLSVSFHFYRQAGDSCKRVFESCQAAGWNTVVLCGLSELAEIAYLRAHEQRIEIVGLYDPQARNEFFFKVGVFCRLADLPEHDALVLTDVQDAGAFLEQLAREQVDTARILIPDLLGVRLSRTDHLTAFATEPNSVPLNDVAGTVS